jgi:hypothetical protein
MLDQVNFFTRALQAGHWLQVEHLDILPLNLLVSTSASPLNLAVSRVGNGF